MVLAIVVLAVIIAAVALFLYKSKETPALPHIDDWAGKKIKETIESDEKEPPAR